MKSASEEVDMQLKIRQFFERHDAKDRVRGFVQEKMESTRKSVSSMEIDISEPVPEISSTQSECEPCKMNINLKKCFALNMDRIVAETTVIFDVTLLGKRFRSEPFEYGRSIVLDWNIQSVIPEDPNEIINLDPEMRICLASDYPTPRFIGLCTIDWRNALKSGNLTAKCDILGVHNEVAGCLEYSIEIPDFIVNTDLTEVVTLQFKQEQLDLIESEREFSAELRLWWKELVQLTRNKFMPVTSREIGSGKSIIFNSITPFSHRMLMTPAQCLRYCYLLAPIDVPIGGVVLPNWAVMASRCGSEKEKLNLLASLLRGFGLDAYVVMSKPRGCVVTLGESLMFYDVANGKYGPKVPSAISEVNFIYNDEQLSANLKQNVKVCEIDWDIRNPLKWKCLYAGEGMYSGSPPVALLERQEFDEKLIEFQLKEIIRSERAKFGRETKWNYDVEKALLPMVEGYEREKRSGSGKDGRALQSEALGRSLRPLYSLKAAPAISRSVDPRDIFRDLMDTGAGLDILGVRERDAAFALCLRVHYYCEGVFCVWSVFAVESMRSLETQ